MERGVVKLQYVSNDDKNVDVFTKPLSKVNFKYFRENLGVV